MRPFSNLNFLQLCVVLSMLGMIAVGVLFGLRGGSAPPWLVAVFGGGQPPAAQTEVVEFKDFDVATAMRIQEVVYQPEAKIIPVKPQIKAAAEPKIAPLPERSESLALPAAPTSDVWQTLLAMFATLLLVGASFSKSILTSRN